MKPTLGQTFALSLLGLAAALALLFYIVFAGLRDTLLESSERVRNGASREISDRVSTFLAQAPRTVELFQQALKQGLVDTRDRLSVERALFALMMSNKDVGELTFTYGNAIGFDENGAIMLDPAPRGQLSAVRSFGETGEDRLWSRSVHEEAGKFVADRRLLGEGGEFAALPLHRERDANISDPTTHPTFITPARRNFQGRLLWSDLHWSQLDADLPEAQRRVEVSVQQAVTDAAGKFAGVLRVGLLVQQLDRAVQIRLASEGQSDPHRVFICDREGRLITRLAPEDHLVEFDDDLRIAPAHLPAEVKSALAMPELHAVSEKTSVVSASVRDGGADYLTTFRALPGTQDWLVGIVVPRAFYLGKLVAMRNRVLAVSLGAMLLLVAGGGLILRVVKRAQAQITRESLKMNAFEFSSAPTTSAFRDVSEVLESLEKAKAAMRAMGKYAPIDLVRRLYREKREPTLGGVPMEVSVMFTDIKDFTPLSEKLVPDQLADALGRYLDVMARIIQQETHGTIDKYIGDSIMTIWNAPEPVPDHARMACLAALRCRDAGRALSASAEWRGLPPFETRFGLHRDTALVGHFGAHDRMNYTAIGDSINLASRLESLNKQYGTTIIASERMVEKVREHFEFRLLDLVAVKGKTEAIKIYELLGEKGDARAADESIVRYEEAFAAYAKGEFAAAVSILERNDDDSPSAVLLERCRRFQHDPPPDGWRGVYVAKAK